MNLLKELIQQQQDSLKHFFANLNLAQVNKFIQKCADCKGLLVFTGVGKSGLIAEKIAMTLISTGTRALYLPPSNFLHGDIGIVSQEDIVILLSKSGETEELLNLLPFFQKRNASILSIVSNSQSRIGRTSDLCIELPVLKELCPFDLAPTNSTAVQLLFGDLLAASLMRLKGFSLSEYVENHPAGSIGKKMTLRVKDLMLKEEQLPVCSPAAALLEVLVELSNKKCGCLLVTDVDRNLLGIFTDGDLRRALQRHGSQVLHTKIQELMTAHPLAVDEDLLAWDAIKQMQRDPKKWVMVMPVLSKGKVVGVLRMHDVIQAGL